MKEYFSFTISGLSNQSPQMQMVGYEPKTTFWSDFSIADRFGKDAVKSTYFRACKEWKTNVEYMAELVMVLNHKIWQWYGKDDSLAELYSDLWEKADIACQNNFIDEDLARYYEITN